MDKKPEPIEFSFSIALPMPTRERPLTAYVLVVICCACAGANWAKHPNIGAIINFELAALLCTLHDSYAVRLWRDMHRKRTIMNARREFGVTIPMDASIADATAIVAQTMLLRLPKPKTPHAQA